MESHVTTVTIVQGAIAVSRWGRADSASTVEAVSASDGTAPTSQQGASLRPEMKGTDSPVFGHEGHRSVTTARMAKASTVITTTPSRG